MSKKGIKLSDSMDIVITPDTQGKKGRSANAVRNYIYGENVKERIKAQHRLAKCQAREQQECKARRLSITHLNPKTIIIHSPQSDFAETLIAQSAGQEAKRRETQALVVERATKQEQLRAEQERKRAEREAKREHLRAERERKIAERESKRATRQEGKSAYAKEYYRKVVKPRNARKKQLGL